MKAMGIAMMIRLTFLSHFIICLAVAAAAWFAHMRGVFGAVWAGDASHMTSVIGVLFVGTAAWLGWQAWLADSVTVISPVSGRRWNQAKERWAQPVDAEWGHLAKSLLPACGLFGTVFGLSLELHAKSAGADVLALLGTALYCTAAGVLTMAIVMVMVFSLERGIARAAR